MTIEKNIDKDRLTVAVSGKLNTVTSQKFADELKCLNGVKELVLDFAGLEQITSAGLRVLLEIQYDMTEQQSRMIVKNVSDAVHEVFELTGFVNFLTIE